MPLTQDDRRVVELMISKAITNYDEKQAARHESNLAKFDALRSRIDKWSGAIALAVLLVPVLLKIFGK